MDPIASPNPASSSMLSSQTRTKPPLPSEWITTTETTTYTWDVQDRLSSVTLPATVAAGVSTPSRTFRYDYDYRTRRVGTHEQPSALSSSPTAAKHTSIIFSGGLSVAEWESSGSQPSTLNSQPTVEYTRGPDMGGGVGGLLYTSRSESASASVSVSSSRTIRYNLSNGRGDIVAQSDAYASLTWTASYEAYGKRTKETGENKDKQRGNSKDEDPTGVLNEGFRYRDIETGVWLSRDPAGFVDGPNLYAYVMQNPWTAFDPNGLETHYLFYYVNPESDKAKSFERAAQTQKREIESGKGFNPKKDKVVLKPITTAKDLTEGWKDMSEQSERGGSEAVKNVKVFTHSGKGDDVDGPKIHLKGGSVGEKGIEGLPKATYAKDAEINLHGCNSGVPGKKGNDSVAQNFADGQGVPATGQSGYAYFSEKTGEYDQIDDSGSPSTEVHLQAFNRGRNGYFGDSKNRAEAKAEPKKPALEKEKLKK